MLGARLSFGSDEKEHTNGLQDDSGGLHTEPPDMAYMGPKLNEICSRHNEDFQVSSKTAQTKSPSPRMLFAKDLSRSFEVTCLFRRDASTR